MAQEAQSIRSLASKGGLGYYEHESNGTHLLRVDIPKTRKIMTGVWTLSLLLLSFHTLSGMLTLLNHTIDDTLGDSITGAVPIYMPSSKWNQGNTCVGCHINSTLVNTSHAFDSTWHDSTYYGTEDNDIVIAFNFTGSAIYIYHILANTVPQTATLTNLEFYIDGGVVGNFTHEPDIKSDILYDIPVYTNVSIPNGSHAVEIRPAQGKKSLLLFDYAAYTVEEEVNVSQSPSRAATDPSSTHKPSNPYSFVAV